MEVDLSTVIAELLNQNTALRLELAVLSALKKHQDDIDAQMKQPQDLSPEMMELLSKLDIR